MANRTHRKYLQQLARQGNYDLRVVGSEKTGFQVAVQRSRSGAPTPISPVHSKQKSAVAWGQRKTGRKAVKLLAKKAA